MRTVDDMRVTVTAQGDDMRDVAVGHLLAIADEHPNARVTFATVDRAEVHCPDTNTLWAFVRSGGVR